MSTRNCQKCGVTIPLDATFCPSCGANLVPPLSKINTHSFGWMLVSFVFSLLWLKIDTAHVFPLGFFGGLAVAFWSFDIDKALGKKTYLGYSVMLSVVGMIIGALTP